MFCHQPFYYCYLNIRRTPSNASMAIMGRVGGIQVAHLMNKAKLKFQRVKQ